jgi:hypothetical protein
MHCRTKHMRLKSLYLSGLSTIERTEWVLDWNVVLWEKTVCERHFHVELYSLSLNVTSKHKIRHFAWFRSGCLTDWYSQAIITQSIWISSDSIRWTYSTLVTITHLVFDREGLMEIDCLTSQLSSDINTIITIEICDFLIDDIHLSFNEFTCVDSGMLDSESWREVH